MMFKTGTEQKTAGWSSARQQLRVAESLEHLFSFAKTKSIYFFLFPFTLLLASQSAISREVKPIPNLASIRHQSSVEVDEASACAAVEVW